MSMEMKFTKKAKDAILNAEMSANKLKNKVLSIDNLLYGLAAIEDCLAAAVLNKYYVNKTT